MTAPRKFLGSGGVGLAVILLVGVVVRLTATTVRVTTEVMEPTLRPGDRLLVDRGAYARAAPQRGHLVAYRRDGAFRVGRVLGLPGERVSFPAGSAYVDEEPLVEPYVRGKLNQAISDIAVPEGHVFVFRDNRELPLQIPQEVLGLPLRGLAGRVTFRYWPPWRLGRVE